MIDIGDQMNALLWPTLTAYGYSDKITEIKKHYGHDPINAQWPAISFINKLKIIQAWCDLLSTPYMRERYLFKKENYINYQLNPEDFIVLLSLQSPTPERYMLKIEKFFQDITDSLIPDEYLLFSMASTIFCYRHVLAYLSKQKATLSIRALNPLLVNAVSHFSSGFTITKTDKIPNQSTLQFIHEMLQAIDQKKTLLDLIDAATSEPNKVTLIFENIIPLEKPSKHPVWNKQDYQQLIQRIQSLLMIYESNPALLYT